MREGSRGFTLMEMMIVLALAGVILGLGAPSFNEFRRNNRLTGVANDYLGAVQTARTEAIKRQVPVAVCPSDDGIACTAGTFRGWIAFVDTDNDCARTTTDTTEPLVRVETRIDGDPAKPLYPVSSGVCISFGGDGFRQAITGKATASYTVFCDTRGNGKQDGTDQSAARGIEVTPTGRVRITRVITEIDDWKLGCPP